MLLNSGFFQCDDFPVTEKVALQLAGLQAQVALGDPREKSKLEYYTNIDTYLPYRISRTRGDDVWVSFLMMPSIVNQSKLKPWKPILH